MKMYNNKPPNTKLRRKCCFQNEAWERDAEQREKNIQRGEKSESIDDSSMKKRTQYIYFLEA